MGLIALGLAAIDGRPPAALRRLTGLSGRAAPDRVRLPQPRRGQMDLFEEARPGQNAPEFTVSEIAGGAPGDRRRVRPGPGCAARWGGVAAVERHLYLDLRTSAPCSPR